MGSIKIISWNVNGVRAITKKDFLDDIKAINPDIFCLQETKATVADTEKALSTLSEYKIFANESKARKGYSGTAIVTKVDPISVTFDMGEPEHDQEGRVVTAEFKDFYLVNVYVPNSGEGMKRLDYRATWDEALLSYCQKLEATKPVILTGDLNVAHTEIDIARAKENYNKSSGYTQTEIDGLERFFEVGFVDTFRKIYPEEVKYSWWNYKFSARQRNVGWRIDYFLISKALESRLQKAEIYNEYFGSDHCPVSVEINF
jgi:exodeoxyribonuclease-3